MPKTLTDYSQTKVYKLCCNDPAITDIYVGHTTNFKSRKHNHKMACLNEQSSNYNIYVYQFIREHGNWDNWSMVQLEEFSCNNSREATLKERQWIDLLKPTLNCVNPYAYDDEKKQQKQQWYEDNKTAILEKAKEHYEEHKDQKLAYQKQYAQQHKEVIAERQKEYGEKNKERLQEQKKAYREEHKEEAKVAQKEWREANKLKLAEQKAQVILCECGHTYTFGNKHRHLQSKAHTTFQNMLGETIATTEDSTENIPASNDKDTKEKQRAYREKNADKIKAFKKQYNDAHKEHIKAQSQQYYEDHKEEIKLKNAQYAESNQEKTKEYKQQWYQKNKETLLAKQKQTFTCDCGSHVRCAGKQEHFQSAKHIAYMNAIL